MFSVSTFFWFWRFNNSRFPRGIYLNDFTWQLIFFPAFLLIGVGPAIIQHRLQELFFVGVVFGLCRVVLAFPISRVASCGQLPGCLIKRVEILSEIFNNRKIDKIILRTKLLWTSRTMWCTKENCYFGLQVSVPNSNSLYAFYLSIEG